MTNEMGNQNTSGIKEEEKLAVEVPEAQEVGDADKATTEENNIIPDNHTVALHEKEDYLQSNDQPTPPDTSSKTQEPDEKVSGGKESVHDQQPEASMESKVSVSKVNDSEEADAQPESYMENILHTNDKLQIHDQCSTLGEIKGQDESSSSTSDDTSSPIEECQINVSLEDGWEAKTWSATYSIDEERKNVDYKDTNGNVVDLMLEEVVLPEEKPSEQTEKCHKNEIEILENGHGNNGDVQMLLKVNLNDSSSSPTETIPEIGSETLLLACPELQEKDIIHTEEFKATSIESEDGNKPYSHQVDQPSELTVNQLDEATASTMIHVHEESCKENGDKNTLGLSSGTDLEKVLLSEAKNVIHNDTGSILVDKEIFVAPGQEQYSKAEETVLLPKMLSVSSNDFGASEKCDEEATEKYSVEETEKRTQEPGSTKKTTRRRGISQSFHSFGGENELVPGYHTSQINSLNGQEAAYLAPSFNSLSGNGLLMGSLAAEHENRITVSLKQDSSHEVLINEISTSNAQNACSVRIMTVEESPLLPSSKAQENAGRLSIDSNPDHPNQRVQLIRRSPSFEFGLPLDARSEESDQTPLLVRDKSLARSFSGITTNVKFQGTVLASDHRQKSLDYEPIQVEEKTIRMERSTSDISGNSFMNFLKNDASEKQDSSNAADQNALESPSGELPLTSVKVNGKRKPRSSLLSACICCSAVIH